MYRLITFQRVACTLLVSAVIGSAMTAQAAGPEANAAPNKNRHCVAQLDPLIPGQKASAVTDMGCFATFAESIAAATGGEVILSPDATPNSITESDVESAVTRIIGIDYDGSFFTGSSITWFVSNPNGCFFNFSYVANMPGFFNNRLTSTRAFSGCGRNTSFSGFFQTGFFRTCFPSCAFIGSLLNNTTSSKFWRR